MVVDGKEAVDSADSSPVWGFDFLTVLLCIAEDVEGKVEIRAVDGSAREAR